MIASQLITELQKAIAEHGDLPVIAHDGLDPSDPTEVSRVDRETSGFFGPKICGYFSEAPHLRLS